MPRFCANLTMLFNEHEFLERFHSALVRALEKLANFEIGQ